MPADGCQLGVRCAERPAGHSSAYAQSRQTKAKGGHSEAFQVPPCPSPPVDGGNNVAVARGRVLARYQWLLCHRHACEDRFWCVLIARALVPSMSRRRSLCLCRVWKQTALESGETKMGAGRGEVRFGTGRHGPTSTQTPGGDEDQWDHRHPLKLEFIRTSTLYLAGAIVSQRARKEACTRARTCSFRFWYPMSP